VAGEPLLNGASPVPDSFFTASSEWSVTYAAHKARLEETGIFWCPTQADRDAIPRTLFLQVVKDMYYICF